MYGRGRGLRGSASVGWCACDNTNNINHVHTNLVGLGGVGWCDRTTVAQWELFWMLIELKMKMNIDEEHIHRWALNKEVLAQCEPEGLECTQKRSHQVNPYVSHIHTQYNTLA